ncbi:unnamed protein product [Arabis nemorensis]|uniref:Uncharacterized protein n=1 Tax=Arabis nemorensis TaxID=586526 RepID=A0A565CSP6_9BRAS|nr:unnamed protein product [Arabis nemorensis]
MHVVLIQQPKLPEIPRKIWSLRLENKSVERRSGQDTKVLEKEHSLFKKLEELSLIPSIFGERRSNVFDPFSQDVWDPFEGFFTPVANANASTARDLAAFTNAKVDWKQTPEAHVFKADLPGLKKEEVKVEVEDKNILQISGERSKENEEKNDKWHRVERASGKFMRSFRLPENAKVEEVKATMENGVLTVTVPKTSEKKPDVKSIDISG